MFSKGSFGGKRGLFFEACKVGDLEMIRKIVDDGINPTMVVCSNCFDEVPLHWACRLVLAITIITIVRELYGTTDFVMMMITVRFGHLEVVRYLIEECGCSPGQRDIPGWTPLHYASV